ncbi:MAG: pantoate--beta-alanine ligase [Candidatus Gastranaerophilales bacterium]|nr:pantoate--beta-alanine ligase [Candidatus Gastranaerophilales bacterium]
MQIISNINEIRKIVKKWQKNDETIGLVPTMGALHLGHESLVKKAKTQSSKVIVSIFVNPIQFAPNEDFEKYPRTLEKDSIICQDNNVDVIFAPNANEMYADKNNLTIIVPPKNYQNKLCGLSRNGHFDGVATVVAKLFNIIHPDKAFFGQKDAQQLAIIKKMVLDLNMPVEIVSCPIIRDENGLALSSRNSYLSAEQKIKALSLNKVLQKIKEMYEKNETNHEKVLKRASILLDEAFDMEYLEAYDANTLEKIEKLRNNTLIAIAAKIGNVRLIDNIIL